MMWTQERLAAYSDEEVRGMLDFEELLRSEAMDELHKIQIRLDEHMAVQFAEDDLTSFVAEVGRKVKNLEKRFSDINNNMDLLRERLSQIPEEPNFQEEQDMTLELTSETPHEELNIPIEEYGVDKEEKNVEDENVNINEDCKAFNVVDSYLDTDDGLKDCLFHFYLTPFFDFHVDCSNEFFLKCGGIFDRGLELLVFQDMPMIVKPSYEWDSTDGVLKFDEKWPPPLPPPLVSSF